MATHPCGGRLGELLPSAKFKISTERVQSCWDAHVVDPKRHGRAKSQEPTHAIPRAAREMNKHHVATAGHWATRHQLGQPSSRRSGRRGTSAFIGRRGTSAFIALPPSRCSVASGEGRGNKRKTKLRPSLRQMWLRRLLLSCCCSYRCPRRRRRPAYQIEPIMPIIILVCRCRCLRLRLRQCRCRCRRSLPTRRASRHLRRERRRGVAVAMPCVVLSVVTVMGPNISHELNE